ncbi:uncharacterized protein CMU_041540 [Cryptosporidium muris RN66]|uniref:PCI domain-containing protein n=1 Tax=Cryptosporidium muris (strain RN66) TaxID=441375 RepID=B6AA41_CRYMR|nr:uncharacterized protein CMU_041540 [Cryptosporidium muris RN66]EEA05082.1 hypothetical protein, conserved [Cryptosporidium muris RN66]|eukprot:XP_002139431.1 hypothetical protein [Cryptosporidium muris RN66]
MLTFHKPENAIRRVEELRSIGQDETALQLLHSVVNHRRFRVHGWDSSQELMMIQYIALSVDLQRPRMAREGLHQYRYVTHQSNVGSLGKVIVEFRNRAEEQLQSVKNECTDCMDPSLIRENLEQEETPESLLLASLQIERRGAKEKKLHETLRFMWETYKMILDIIRLTPKLERTYHETAQKALEFCWQHNRASEFKTLCELLRSHYQLLITNRHKPEIELMLRPECHLETRIVQLRGAAKLSLWNECFMTAEEIFHLGLFQHDPIIGKYHSSGITYTSNPGNFVFSGTNMSVPSGVLASVSHGLDMSALSMKVRPTYLRWIALYYDILSKMFLLTENYSFHALAHMKYFLHLKQFKKNVSSSELGKMASTVVLATLSIPLSENSMTTLNKSKTVTQVALSLSSICDGFTHSDQVKRAALLLGSPYIPNREILKAMLLSKGILQLASPICRELYDVIEGKANTLKICINTHRYFTSLQSADEDFREYVRPLKSTALTKLFLLISRVYSSISIDQFLQEICPNEFLPWTETEKLLVQLSNSSLIQLRIDYARRSIYSHDKGINNIYMNKWNIDIAIYAFKLESLMRKLNTENISGGVSNQYTKISQMVGRRLPIEMATMDKRIEEIRFRRKERREELRRVEEDKKRQEKEAKAQEELLEIQKREEDRRRREEARQREEIRRGKIEACQNMLETIKKLVLKHTANSSKTTIKGKALDDITLDDLMEGRIQYDDLEKLQEEQCNFERQERIRQRKMEAKRLDHLARAFRTEEIPLLRKWREETIIKDKILNENLQERYQIELNTARKEARSERELLKNLLPYLNKWKEAQLEVRKDELKRELESQKYRCIKKIKEMKIARAKVRRNEYIERKQKEDEQRRKEEESRLLEEKRSKMQKQIEIQRKRDEEIEAKLKQQYANTSHEGRGQSDIAINQGNRRKLYKDEFSKGNIHSTHSTNGTTRRMNPNTDVNFIDLRRMNSRDSNKSGQVGNKSDGPSITRSNTQNRRTMWSNQKERDIDGKWR